MCVYACYTVYFSRSNKLRSTTNDTKCTVLAAKVTRCSLITHDKAGRKTIMTVIYMEQLQFRRIFSRYLKKSEVIPHLNLCNGYTIGISLSSGQNLNMAAPSHHLYYLNEALWIKGTV